MGIVGRGNELAKSKHTGAAARKLTPRRAPPVASDMEPPTYTTVKSYQLIQKIHHRTHQRVHAYAKAGDKPPT